MYEPKYKLNKKDEARYRELLTRHCCEAPFIRPGVPRKRPSRKYPPLTPEENAEFERLHEKERRKRESHPIMKRAIRRSRYLCAKAEKLSKRLDQLLAKRRKVIKH